MVYFILIVDIDLVLFMNMCEYNASAVIPVGLVVWKILYILKISYEF